MSNKEIFRPDQTIDAVEQFLKTGESGFHEWHQGYFSGSGFAARCLRSHLEDLKNSQDAESPDHRRIAAYVERLVKGEPRKQAWEDALADVMQ